MNKKVPLGILVVVVVLGGYFVLKNKKPLPQVEQNIVPNITGTPTRNDMSVYHNDTYGFELQYPTGSTIQPSTHPNATTDYIRIQNFKPKADTDHSGLAANEYYLEIFIRKDQRSCKDQDIFDAVGVDIGPYFATKGTRQGAGEAPGGPTLCVDKNDVTYTLNVTDGSPGHTVANLILDSFKFTGQNLSVCPFVLGESVGYQVLMNECTPVKDTFSGSILKYLYRTSSVTVAATDGSFKKIYNFIREFGPGGIGGFLSLDPTKSYLLMDEGTWVVRSLTIFSLKDNRTAQIRYIHKPIFTKNGYLLYDIPSDEFSNAHQEVDQSSALDVAALKLSDFSMKYLYQGDAKTDYTLDSYSGDTITVTKYVYNDPAHIDAGGTRTKITMSASDL